MNKKTYSSTKLTCVLQEDYEITTDKCHTGIISVTSDGFLFQESIRKGRPPRNPNYAFDVYCDIMNALNLSNMEA